MKLLLLITLSLLLVACNTEYEDSSDFRRSNSLNSRGLDQSMVVSEIPNQQHNTGFSSISIELSDVFLDVDNDLVSFFVNSSAPTVVTATVSGGVLTVTEVGVGTSIITLTAEEPNNRIASTAFELTVINQNSVANAWTRRDCPQAFGLTDAVSEWVFLNADDRLSYQTLPTGDQILDFSYAGYMGGGVALPDVSQLPDRRVIRVAPSGGDDTSNLQDAIDQVARLQLNSAGLRGVVRLEAGNYRLFGNLSIRDSGVILQGAPTEQGVQQGTTISVLGADRVIVHLAGSGRRNTFGGRTAITNDYVPVGSRTLTVEDASGFSVGDDIIVARVVTADWIRFMEMDNLRRDGERQTWIDVGSTLTTERSIVAIDDNRITLDIPMNDAIDATYMPNASIVKYRYSDRISQVGVENIEFIGSYNGRFGGGYRLMSLNNIIDSWVRNVKFGDFATGIQTSSSTKRITFDNVSAEYTVSGPSSGARPTLFSADGEQLLYMRVSSEAREFIHFTTQAMVSGPNVVLDYTSSNGGASGHQRWATGLLVDRSNLGNVQFYNRGFYGSGHGWTTGWSVAWNTHASNGLLIQSPPGAENWAIGSTGNILRDSMPGGNNTLLPTGIIDSHGTRVTPESLYLAQLCLRLGPSALTNIGY